MVSYIPLMLISPLQSASTLPIAIYSGALSAQLFAAHPPKCRVLFGRSSPRRYSDSWNCRSRSLARIAETYYVGAPMATINKDGDIANELALTVIPSLTCHSGYWSFHIWDGKCSKLKKAC